MSARRKCAKCGEPQLLASMEYYKSARPYVCANCGTEIKLAPIAMLGMQLTIIGMFSLAGLWWVIFLSGQSVSFVALAFAIVFWLFMSLAAIGFTIFKIRIHYLNPVVPQTKEDSKLDRPESWIESKNLLFGLSAPIIFIAVFVMFFGGLQLLSA